MKYLIVMFSSRTDTMRFYNIIKKYNGFCSIVNTPHSLSRSCGISVKIGHNLIPTASKIITSNNFNSFKGVFEIDLNSPHDNPKRIF